MDAYERWKQKMEGKVQVAKKRRDALNPNAPDYQLEADRCFRRVKFLRHTVILAEFRTPANDGPPPFQIHFTPREE
ncbi:hypothetical protein QEG98_42020 (plasmid) [Myxococcus sp. MxC21-1]|uniref:hypothetical protein n=1 Tax=Myxococcus sp. MxC21-1 TaxID=3041439 RepID=UPI00292CC85A|nr:hypothetical protein [Myxococcus sp. MxC21-1]WNZ66246.1 hypothetical protein QEG98_42020 [Myxococcus sp. MxC21-1]